MGAGTVPTGFDELDRYLPGGGWPIGAITEIFLERYGIGELSLLMPALSSLSGAAARQWIVWIAPPFVPYAPALHRCGLDLSRVLLVHPSGTKAGATKQHAMKAAGRNERKNNEKKDVLWATEQAIRSRSSAVVLAWVETADATVLRRMQLGAEENACWTVLFRPMAAVTKSSPAALRLKLSRAATDASRPLGSGREANHVQIDILKCRGRWPGSISLESAVLRARRPDVGSSTGSTGSGSSGHSGGSESMGRSKRSGRSEWR